MPLLYGEEGKAFRRLQEEIIRTTVDLSILAWSLPPSQYGWHSRGIAEDGVRVGEEPHLCGLLAKSPADFWACGRYENLYAGGLREFGRSNIGIKVRARLQGVHSDGSSYRLILPINCSLDGAHLGVFLKQAGRSTYLRQDPWALYTYDREFVITPPFSERYLLSDLSKDYTSSALGLAPPRATMQRMRKYALRVQPFVLVPFSSIDRTWLTLGDPWPADRCDHEDTVFIISHDPDHDIGIINVICTCFINLTCHRFKCTIISLGWSEAYTSRPQFGIVPLDEYASILTPFRDRDPESWQRQPRSEDIAIWLARSRIPRTSSLHLRIEGTNEMVVLSIDPIRLNNSDNDVSHGVCYDLRVCVQIVKASKASPVEQEEWEF